MTLSQMIVFFSHHLSCTSSFHLPMWHQATS